MQSYVISNIIDILVHKIFVFWYLLKICYVLVRRGILHDLSKFSKEEFKYYKLLNLRKLRNTQYASPEYYELLKPAIQGTMNHYLVNSHHPQFYNSQVEKMTLLDQLEMLADWRAACRRNNNNMLNSLTTNKKRFKIKYNKILAYKKDCEEIGFF